MTEGILDSRQKKAISLLVSRDVNGLNYTQIAEEVGISTATLYNWRHDYHFRQELERQSDEVVQTYISDVYRQLGRILNDPNAHSRDVINAGQVILKLRGKFTDKIEVETSNDMSDLLERLDKAGK